MKDIALTNHNKFSLVEPLTTVKMSQNVSSKYKNMLVVIRCEFTATYLVPAWNETTEIHIIGLFPIGVNPEDFPEILDIDEGNTQMAD